ncbi:PAS domain-containing sensor histidine kinase [Dictyobacter alpinus]|uniref:PAS domain-containing sensor histidine kinase n=1 Tax=Dictyobacter alpinus TaxID=2014873 RepID=UPI001387436E|nr:ATP-binding protein [Dictyobacter alpinus]
MSVPVVAESSSLEETVNATIENTSVKRRHAIDAAIVNTSDAIIAIRQDFQLTYLNPAAATKLGIARQDAVGKSCTELLGCQNLNRMLLCGTSSCPLTQALEKQTSLPNEELILGTDPLRRFEASASVNPIHLVEDDFSYAIFTARDMSALKVANRVRSNFVSMVSHELRTPLNSVHGFIDLLLQGHMGEMNDEQRMYLGYTQEGVQQLISIVEDILFMSRSDLGQFEVKQQEVHLLGLVRQVVLSLQPQAIKAEVELCLDMTANGPALFIDPQRIKQVLNNLVANAIKFTPPGGTVTVSASQHDEHFAMISVSDTGYGIPTEDGQHVFERFYQSNHSQQSKMGGYGLGLSIARLIVEQHGGTIGFDTVVNKGTTFYFTLPLYDDRCEV